jgi:LPXTG-motif cell wall-anchored protein
MGRGVQRTAAVPRLNDDSDPGHRGDQPVSLAEFTFMLVKKVAQLSPEMLRLIPRNVSFRCAGFTHPKLVLSIPRSGFYSISRSPQPSKGNIVKKSLTILATLSLAFVTSGMLISPSFAAPTGTICPDVVVLSTVTHWNQPTRGLVSQGDGTYRLPGVGENAAPSGLRPCSDATKWSSNSGELRDGYFAFTTNPEQLFETADSTVISFDIVGSPAAGGFKVSALDVLTGEVITPTLGNESFWLGGAVTNTLENTVHYEYTLTPEQAADARDGHFALFLGAFGDVIPGTDTAYFLVDSYATSDAPSGGSGNSDSSLAATGVDASFALGVAAALALLGLGFAVRRRRA